MKKRLSFVVACTLCRLAGWSVTLSFFQRYLVFFALLLLPKCLVSFYITGPAHPHATSVVVYPSGIMVTLLKKDSMSTIKVSNVIVTFLSFLFNLLS